MAASGSPYRHRRSGGGINRAFRCPKRPLNDAPLLLREQNKGYTFALRRLHSQKKQSELSFFWKIKNRA